ncbi:MAG: hypothetical protein DI530_13695 [Sphingomonas sp.]|nr:MAG: hypothetical protein DI530_13695 [Sphingomonas sp.]
MTATAVAPPPDRRDVSGSAGRRCRSSPSRPGPAAGRAWRRSAGRGQRRRRSRSSRPPASRAATAPAAPAPWPRRRSGDDDNPADDPWHCSLGGGRYAHRGSNSSVFRRP